VSGYGTPRRLLVPEYDAAHACPVQGCQANAYDYFGTHLCLRHAKEIDRGWRQKHPGCATWSDECCWQGLMNFTAAWIEAANRKRG
jgi:hypothetical protein